MTIALVRAHTAGQNKASSTTVSGAIVTAAVPAGSLLVAAVAFDNTSATAPTVTGISKPGTETNNWVIFQGANSPDATAAGGIRVAMAYIITTVTWNVAQTVVATLSAAVTAKAIAVEQFSGTGFVFVDDVIGVASTTGAPSVTLPSASTDAGWLAVGMAGFENTGTPTADADTTNGTWGAATGLGTTGGSGITNITVGMQHKIMTAAGDQIFNPSLSQDSMAIIMSFREPITLAATVTTTITSALSATPVPVAQKILELDAGNTSSYPGSGTTWTDLAGTASNFTLSGSPAFDTDGGGSLVFGSGKTAASGTESTLDMASVFTIDAWVKPADTLNSSALFARDIGLDGYGLRWTTGDFVPYGNGAAAGSAPGTAGVWQHVVAVFGGSTTDIWINGTLIDSDTPHIPAGSGAFVSYISPAGENFNGKIAILRVWDMALSSTKIASLYSAESARFASGPAQLPATVTIPIASVVSASPKARLVATMTVADVVSTNIANPIKRTPATVITAIVSTVAASGTITTPAVQWAGTMTVAIVSGNAASATKLSPATVTMPILSDGSVSVTKLAPGTVSTPIASAVVAGGTKLTAATVITPVVTTVAVTPTKLTSGAASTAIVSTVAATAGQSVAGVQWAGTVTVAIVSDNSASAILTRPASVTIPIVSTTTPPDTTGTLVAAVTIPIVSEDDASVSKLTPASITSAIISALAVTPTKLTSGTVTSSIVSSSNGTAILRAVASTTIAVISQNSISPTSILRATVTTTIISTMNALASPSGAGFNLPIVTTVGAAAGQRMAASVTVAIASTVVTSPTKRTSGVVTSVITSGTVVNPGQRMTSAVLSQITSGFGVTATSRMAAAVITSIISQTIVNAFLVGSGTGVYIGTDEVLDIYVGDQPIAKVYYGSELVWSAT